MAVLSQAVKSGGKWVESFFKAGAGLSWGHMASGAGWAACLLASLPGRPAGQQTPMPPCTVPSCTAHPPNPQPYLRCCRCCPSGPTSSTPTRTTSF